MKGNFKRLYLLLALIGLGWFGSFQSEAQTFTSFYSFSARDTNSLNSDGVYPPGLVLSGNTLYGTASYGGTNDGGTIFAISTTGTGFTKLFDFDTLSSIEPYLATNHTGSGPMSGLAISGNTLFGTTYYGGAAAYGTVFRINTDGSGFTNLHSFSGGSDGAQPFSSVVVSGGVLYGTTVVDGPGGHGTVFALNTDGTGYTNVHGFSNGESGGPIGGLVISGNTLYGTTMGLEPGAYGTVFAVNMDGTSFTNLHNFTSVSGVYYQGGTNSDGAFPVGSLIISENTLYGTAQYGGINGAGTVFKVNTDGTGFIVLHSFTSNAASSGLVQFFPNSDGGNPGTGLVLNENTLYGKSQLGGTAGLGTIFALNTDGSGFTNLHNFMVAGDGLNPSCPLILSGNALYGTASIDGATTNGAVFKLYFAPQLSLASAGTNVVLSWPTNVAGFDYTGYTVQSSTGIGSATNWSTLSAVQGIVGGQCVVTNPVSGTPIFYRLSH